MSIALLNIPCENITERRYDRPNYPDPSLGSLHSYLKNKNIESHIIDSKLERLKLPQIIDRLRFFNPDVIGFTSFTHEIDRISGAAKSIKENFPKTKLLIGGSHSNALPGEVLIEYRVFDISLYGEGEATITELINKNFQKLDSIHGIAYRQNGNIILNRPREYIDPKTMPSLDWTVFPKAKYYPIFTSRGCNYNCIFCARPLGSNVRFRAVDDVLDEIENNVKLFKPETIYFWDENLCADRNRIERLLITKKKNKTIRNVRWFCQSHANNLDYDLLKLMKESGCIRIGIGIESGNEEILRKIGKGVTKKRIINVMAWLKKVNIPVEGYFLFGLPGETRKTCLDTINFAAELNPKFPVFGIVVPYPGTAVYKMALAGKGDYRIISSRWSDYNKIIGKAVELENVPRKELEIMQFRGYFAVLFKNFRILDMIRFLFQYSQDIRSYILNFFRSRYARAYYENIKN